MALYGSRTTPRRRLLHLAVVAGNRHWWSPGRPVIPYGLERLADLVDQNPIGFWVEGETDLLALRAWATALDNRPVVGLSAPGAGTWQPAWRRYMRSFTTIYAVGDGDDVGRRFTARIVEAIPWARPIWLDDGEDVRSIVQSAHPDRFLDLVGAADAAALGYAALMVASTPDEYARLIGGDVDA